MLADEAAGAQARHGSRLDTIELASTDIYCRVALSEDDTVTFRFGGAGYDAEPFQVAVVTEDGDIAPPSGWPPGIGYSVHPILERPFICIRGTYEYHCHPSHLTDSWAAYRQSLRLPQLVGHLLRRVGR
jgi:hypothetical protein